ncbi:bacterial bifunctional deaminase-reductase [Neolentinus lepideus HHB14362 ss-1]|uniref:2,5-diamino-6-ribosylamino-4(3H)-pyrimidinone 5'-phosphate reductase n=1 Tax=Neolentinus lepideus HHB14362 ss-1 TaxID=1314782 RepID=A0A165WC57_9AGAM|nr:bacterial bifunctional deaminase-reductase [Neolentinus lepideus HHB14362 ss-1]
MASPPAFLTSLYPPPPFPNAHRPHVTLTFAQSLDAKIAGPGGRQVALSGRESMVMTHWMRSMHDAILVGVGTALNDDPQLNTRHLPPHPGVKYPAPRPVILDAYARLPPTCKLLRNYAAGTGAQPIVLCTGHDSERAGALRRAGALVWEVRPDARDRAVSLEAALSLLKSEGIASVMVEGGARVISSFLRAGVVDTLVVTVAPTLLGGDAVGYGADVLGSQVPEMEHVATEVVGRDVVVAVKCRNAK